VNILIKLCSKFAETLIQKISSFIDNLSFFEFSRENNFKKMLIKFLLLVLALAIPSLGSREFSIVASECVKIVDQGTRDRFQVVACPNFNIPDDIPDDLGKVKIFDGQNSNYVENLVAGQFKKLPNLKRMLLRESGIEKVDELAFEGLTQVEILDLSKNYLRKLPENFFKDLVNLQDLNLELNKFKNLPANIFKYNEKLKVLRLNKNLLTQIPTGLFHPLVKLQLLSLAYNQLEVLHQDTFQKNKKLTDLMFAFNKIKAVARGTFANLPKLDLLDFAKNVCIDQRLGKHETFTKLEKYNEVLEKCYTNYEKL
jgi:Leucine-rich repeat (LRR) protein